MIEKMDPQKQRAEALERMRRLQEGDLGRPDLKAAIEAATSTPPQQSEASPQPDTPESSDSAHERVRQFVRAMLEQHPGAALGASELHHAYVQWSDSHGHTPLPLQPFLQATGLPTGRVGGRVRVLNIALKDGDSPELQPAETVDAAPPPQPAAIPDPVFGGEWFAGSTLASPEDATPMEKAQIEKIRKEVVERIKQLESDPALIARITEDAKGVVQDLPKGFGTQARIMSGLVQKAAEDMSSLPAQQKQAFVAEAISAISSGKPLADISGHNPIAQVIASEGRFTQFTSRASATEDARAKDVAKPNTRAYAALGGTALAAALAGYGLEVGTTKTAIIQLNDIYDIPGIKHSIEALTEYLKTKGWKADEAASMSKITVGGGLAAYIGGTLVATKAIGPKNMGLIGKAQFYGSLGASLGLGYLALQNFVADTNSVASIGKVASAEFNPIAEKAKEVKTDRTKLFEEVKTIVSAAVQAEVNRPGAPGYGPYSAFVERGLTGAFDTAKFNEFMSQKGGTLQADHTRLQNALNQLGNEGGLLALLESAQKKVDLETAPAMSDAVVKVGEAAAQLDLWSGLGKVLKPHGEVTTSVGVYRQAKEAADAFSNLLKSDADAIGMARMTVSAHLDAMIRAAGSNKSMTDSLQRLKSTLLQKLTPINAPRDIAQQALAKISIPSGKWVIEPDDTVWTQMQETIKDSQPFKALGWDVATDSPSRPFWRAGLIALLGGFFLTINGGSYLLSRRLNNKREAEFEGAMDKGMEDLNERESFLAVSVATLIEKAQAQFLINSGANQLSYPIPPSLIELHVRRSLRDEFLKEEGDSLGSADRFGWFVHGLAFGKTPEDVRMFLSYNSWLDSKLKAFDSDPAAEIEQLVASIYPHFNKTIEANDAVIAATSDTDKGEKMKVLESELRKMRREQLKQYATLINERLAVLNLTEDERSGEAADTDIRLNLEDTKIIVSRDAALSAYAHRNITGERVRLEETLEYIRRLGISPDRTVSDEDDELKIGSFGLGPKYALRDQLQRIRAARELNMPHSEGSADDFERVDQYMTRVAEALREVRADVFADEQNLKDLYPDFVWRKSDGGPYTIHIDLYRDSNRLGNPVGSLTYTKPIPDFSSETPEDAVRGLVEWLQEGGPAVQGLVAQERHSFYEAEHRRLLAELRRSGGGKPEIVLVDGGRKNAPDRDTVDTFAKAYALSELLDEQAGSIGLARRGIRIEPSKFRAFIAPEEYMSNKRSGIELANFFEDILARDYPSDAKVTYSASTLRFSVTKVGRRLRVLGPTSETGTPVSIRIRDYKSETLERALREISSVDQSEAAS